jgi:hypothetical protein
VDIDARPDVVVELPALVVGEDGRYTLEPVVPARWHAALRSCLGQVRVAIMREKRTRTSPQNRFLWGVVYETLLYEFRQIAVDAKEQPPFKSKDDVHEAMKYRFLGVEVLRLPGGEEMERPASTTKLTTTQFNSYWRAIAEWAATRYEIYIPEPNERAA